MSLGQPGRTLVVEAGERALLEFGLARAGRVESGVAFGDELARGLGDGADVGIGVFGA